MAAVLRNRNARWPRLGAREELARKRIPRKWPPGRCADPRPRRTVASRRALLLPYYLLVRRVARRGPERPYHLGFASMPVIPAYSISKAAAFSLTQSLRALLAGRGVRVHAVLAGPVDTDMTRDADIPKAPPESVARAILDGVENDEEDIFPDPMSESMAESWRGGAAKVLERQLAALVPAERVES
jgi:short chain dehydrogenase